MTDRELLARYTREGSQEAFAEIVRRHTDMVYATCLRILRNGHDAEDAAQAAFLVFMQKARSIPEGAALAGWLFRAAENSARNVQTIVKRRERHEAEAAMTAQAERTNDGGHEARAHLDAALAALPPGLQRDAIVLRYLSRRTHAEAALELGCPVETLHTRLTRALEKLRARLSRRDVRLSAVLLLALLERCKEQSAPPALSSSIHAACLGKAGVSGSAALAAKEVLYAMMLTKVKLAAGLAALAVLGLALWNTQWRQKRDTVVPVSERAEPFIASVPDEGAVAAEPFAAPQTGAERMAADPVGLGLDWLARIQEEDGHYDCVRQGGAAGQDVAVTSLSMLAYLGAGHTARVGNYKETEKKAVAWLAEHPCSGVTQAALRAMALAEHCGMTRRDQNMAQAALDDLIALQGSTGAWEDTSAQSGFYRLIGPTTWAVLALKSAKVSGLKIPRSAWDSVLATLDSQQRDALANEGNLDGAFMAAGIVLQRQFTGAPKDSPIVQQMVKMLPAQRPFFPVDGIGDEAILWHHGTNACFQNGGHLWQEWNESLKAALLPSQLQSGDMAGSWNFRDGSNPFLWGRIGATALATQCLETYYRYRQIDDRTVDEEPAFQAPKPEKLGEF